MSGPVRAVQGRKSWVKISSNINNIAYLGSRVISFTCLTAGKKEFDPKANSKNFFLQRQTYRWRNFAKLLQVICCLLQTWFMNGVNFVNGCALPQPPKMVFTPPLVSDWEICDRWFTRGMWHCSSHWSWSLSALRPMFGESCGGGFTSECGIALATWIDLYLSLGSRLVRVEVEVSTGKCGITLATKVGLFHPLAPWLEKFF